VAARGLAGGFVNIILTASGEPPVILETRHVRPAIDIDPGGRWGFFLPFANTAVIFYHRSAALVRYQNKKRPTMTGVDQF